MAHSCRWRFPARPGGITNAGSGRKAGRIRVTASLRTGTGTHPNTYGLGPGFDAALQVSAAIGNNLQKFRDVFGEASGSSSGEEELFCGFGAHNETRRIQSPARTSTATSTQAKKPRGRPPRALAPPPFPASAPQAKPEGLERPPEKPKRPPGRPPGSGDKRRGRPPALGGQYRDIGLEDSGVVTEGEQWGKKAAARRTALAPVQQQATVKLPRGPRVGGRISKATKLKRLQGVKLGPLKAVERKGVPVPSGPRRRRGRPPSAERLKAEAAAAAAVIAAAHSSAPAGADVSGDRKQKAFRERRERPSDPHQLLELRAPQAAHPDSDIRLLSPSAPPLEPPSSRTGRPAGVRQSPRRIVVPPPKRTDATIAKQLLQRAKKGAQKKKLLEKEGALGGPGAAGVEADIRRRRRTQLKNIRQFIMPVVSTVSLRIIKTPKRFIEESSFGAPSPHLKIPRVDTASPAAGPHQPSSSSSSPLSMQVSSSAPPSLPPPPAPPAPSGLLNNNNSGSCNNSTSNGRFSSSAASCGSSAASQRSSQLSSAESSRSSSPSLESSSDSQGSEATRLDRSPSSQGKGEAASLLHESRPPTPPLGAARLLTGRGRRGRQGQVAVRGGLAARGALTGSRKKSIIGPASGVLLSSSSRVGSKQATSTASSSSSPPPPPPPLLTPPQTTPSSTASASASALSEHHPHSAWIVPHPITPFISTPVLSPLQQEKRHSILREPTFRWESVSRSEQRYFSSAKYAKEGLIRKPVFDNFRPPPLTAEDVGLLPSGGGVTGGVAGSFPGQAAAPGAGSRLFSPLQPRPRQHPSSHFDLQPPTKRSPLLRAPQFTPSEAHSRIFESVTLLSPVGSSAGPAPRQASPATRTPRRRKRKVFGPVSGQPRSPSHPMATRSSQSGMQAGKGSSSPLPGHASTSALTPTSFAAFSTEGAVESYQPAGRRSVGGLAVGGNSSSTSSSPLFPLFSPSPQGAGGSRERGASASQETGTRDRERDQERAKEREKENKKESQKERNRKGKSAAPEGASGTASGHFAADEHVEESSVSVALKKTRKKAISIDSVTEVTSDLGSATGGGSLQVAAATSTSKGRLHKKGRTTDRGQEAEAGCKESNRERSGPPVPQMTQPGAPRKQLPVASLGSMLAQAEKQQVTDKHVAGLLKKAKDQLNKIEKSKSIKTTDLPKAQGQESDSSEASARGPRIKHVCRRAAVALGRNRAVFPDDMPTLSALPWEEREKILSSMGNDDKSSVAGSEEAEPLAPPIKPIKPIKPMTRHKTVQEPPARKGRRSRRCGQCPGCQVPDDCGVCTNCLDKPKFGGRNIKKQCCKVRKCQNLQWMPSKAFLQKQAKAKKEKKNNKMAEKKEAHHSSESDPKPNPPQSREEPTRKKSETPPPKHNEEKPKQPRQQPLPPPSPASKDPPPAPCSPPAQEPKQPVAPPGVTSRKDRKTQPAPPATSAQNTPEQAPSQPPQSPPSQLFAKKEGVVKAAPCEPKKRPQQKIVVLPNTETASEAKQMKRLTPQCSPAPKQNPKEREKLALTKPEGMAVNLPTIGPWTGGHCRPRGRGDGVRRIRVDFKEDRDVENVWEMGGLSILTSVPITPRVVCFLCASSGHVEFVFCQVCCEPFHLFCLDEKERPLQEQLENWCCRRCRFCHVCGRQHQKTKQLLECNKCRNSYHPECLGPNHPTRPTKKKRVWICTMCVRCKSCGATTPGKGWDAQWSHDFSMCHDCAKLFAKGNFCPLCDKCYDDDDYESKMMQCGKCDRWVHSKCENLTDEMYEILSSLPVAYTCTNCTERHPAEWRTALEKELQGSVRQVLTALLNSRTSTHLLRYRQVLKFVPKAVMKPPELNPEPEESLPSRRSPEGPDPPVLTEVTPPSDSPLDLETVKRKMEMGSYNSVLEFSDDIVRIIQTAMNFDGGQPENKKANSMVKSFFIRQMERVFPWFKVKESRFWEPHKVSSNSGLLPNAVLPPSLDHNYAQWQEREEIARAEQPALMKKIIPAPRPKAPGEPDSPTPPSPPCLHGLDLCREECPELLPPSDVGDNRQCALCLKYGDDNTNDSGRLLYIGQNEWTHVNCALWSAEVFEDDDGSLKNVHMAVIRGRQLRCEHCQRPGATVGCCLTSCTSNFHFMCARLRHCVFLEDKKVYCQRHRDLIKGEVVSESGFEVTRRILVDLEGISLRRKFLNGLEPENVHMMIGSMTIDCLGILTELSDCEHKLFPVGYQCSRVYWSTLDARKRCVYTCRILVCRPPVVEPDINHTVEHEENHTISHSSPSSASDLEIPPSPGSTEPLPGRLQPPPPTPVPKAVARSRHPSYPPCQRSPSSRPLPSPGGPSISTHEIVTVGDPVLSSSLRSIGSRRHSTSSLSPQPTNQQTPSPSPGGGKLCRLGVFSSSPSVFTAARDSGNRDIERERPTRPSSIGNQHRESRMLSPSSQSKGHTSISEKRTDGGREGANKQAGEEKSAEGGVLLELGRGSQASLGGAVPLAGHQKINSGYKMDKGKQGGKDAYLLTGTCPVSRGPLATLIKDGSSEDSFMDASLISPPIPKDTVSPSSPQPQHFKSGGRKSRDPLPGSAPAVAMKPLQSSGIAAAEDTVKRGSQATPALDTSLGVSGPKEGCSKGRTQDSRERNSRNSTAQTASTDAKGSGLMEGKMYESQIVESPLKARDRISSLDKKNICATETTHSRFGPEKGFKASHVSAESTGKELSQRDKKRTVKVTLTPLKMDPNGTKAVSSSSSSDTTTTMTSLSPASQGSDSRSSRPLLFSPSASSESLESDAQHHKEDPEEHLLAHRCARADEGDEPPMEDAGGTDKCREDDSDSSASVKRRYPRRSARARANMFFGLTPFYGVRSYGEEDIPFYGSGDAPGKRRIGGGGSKRSAEGQVDGADDMSSSSSGESGEEEEGGIGPCTDEDTYYYNFTRTIIHPGGGIPPAGGLELQRFLKEETEDEEMVVEEGAGIGARSLGLPRIGQLDGVDDGSESDASTSATSTTVTAASTSNKSTSKRKNRDRRAEKLGMDSAKEATNSTAVGGGGSNSRDGRKTQKENCLPLVVVKSQGQDSLDAQLSLNSELLKSDSDNTSSDDCGNILPSDIMEFVLNTPSMQSLGQQQESGSSELLSLEEGFELDGNRGKDISLFEDFPQPLPSADPVEGGVNSSISGEEPYGLPLELPSDLSVLTTRSPSVTNQNHTTLIAEPSKRTVLSLPGEDAVEKGGDKHPPRGGASRKAQSGVVGGVDSQGSEGHLTPEHFIPGHLEAERMTSPPVSQVVEPGSQDLAMSSGTPGLPNSPSMPLQGQKYLCTSAEAPASSQVTSTAVQTTATHLKPGTEKLIVVNQHMQPLYVLQTLPNGVTQKIQISPSVSEAGVMETSSMAGGLALPPGLAAGITTSQSIFAPGGKSLVSMPHHPQIQAFAGATQTGFQPGIPSTTSGLLIGVHSQDPQVLVSEAGHHSELVQKAAVASGITSVSSSSLVSTSGHGKKRPISRLQPRKAKKLARSGSQPSLTPSESRPNMTLINFSPTQIPAGISPSTGMVELGALTAAPPTAHRKIPNIIKRPKLGVFFEPTATQGLSVPTAPVGILPHESSAQLVPCTVSGLSQPNQALLNVVSVPAGGPSGLLGAPGLLSPTEISGMLLPDQQMVLQSGTPQLSGLAQTSNTNNVCELPSQQAVGQQADQVGAYHLQHHLGAGLPLTDKHQILGHSSSISEPQLPASGTVAQEIAGCRTSDPGQSSRTTPISRASDQHTYKAGSAVATAGSTVSGKGKQKAKRSRHNPEEASGRKHKLWRLDSPQENQGGSNMSNQTLSAAGGAPETKAASPVLVPKTMDIYEAKTPAPSPQPPQGKEGSGMTQGVAQDPGGHWKDLSLDSKPRKGLMFEICSDDGFKIRCESIEEAWKSLTDKVQVARSNARLKELSFEGVNGLRMLGVIHDAVAFLLEQLYGARHCGRYRFRFHKPEESDDPPLNPSGIARGELHHRRSTFDVFNFLASKHRQPPKYNPYDEEEEEVQLKSARRATSMDLPMPMRFRHLKKASKEAVGVYRSAIHGRGLFCKRNIDPGEMVIEYSGNVIRSVLTDKREKYYDGKGIGCYMFRIDDFEVVDATIHGNAARFINHSCEPNCYSRVISVEGKKHIVIFAMRKIFRGEELTYDYKFPIEEPGSKLPCNCGAKKCRKFLN